MERLLEVGDEKDLFDHILFDNKNKALEFDKALRLEGSNLGSPLNGLKIEARLEAVVTTGDLIRIRYSENTK